MRIKLHSVRAIVLLAALAILIAAATTVILLWNLHQQEMAKATVERDAIANLVAKEVKSDLNSISLVLKVVQERMQSPYGSRLALDSPEVFLLLGARVAASEPTSSMFIADAAGTIVNTSLGYPPNRLHVADREYFKAFVDDSNTQLFISRPLRNRIDNKWTMYFSRPLRWEDGRLRGVLVAAVPPAKFEGIFDNFRMGAEREMSLHMSDGTLIASQPHIDELTGNQPSQHAVDPPGQRSDDMIAQREIKDFPIYLKVATDKDGALTRWREIAIPVAFAALMVCLSIVVITIWLRRGLVKEGLLQKALSSADERHRHTVTSVMDAIVAIDDKQNIMLFNPAAEHMFGLSAADAIGQPLTVLIPENLRELHQQHVSSFMDSVRPSDMMSPHLKIFGRRANGDLFPIEATISKMEQNGQIQMTAVLRDITERNRAEENLRQANLQLRTLSTALQNVREEERTHISRELHDDLGQQLTGLKLDLTWLGSRIKEGRPVLPERVDEMRQHLDRTIASVRRISSDLRPPVLDDLGFCEAVRWLKQETEKRCDLIIDVEMPAGPMITHKGLATAFFRIVQEALTNILRHANATRVAITLLSEEGRLVLTIQDNGKGVNLEAPRDGFGLISMRERITALGGEFSVVGSTPGMGVCLTATVPFPPPDSGKNIT